MIESIKDIAKDLQEVVKERLFSPMYFYFVIAWVITNWMFVYVLLFTPQLDLGVPKIEYMASLYKIEYWYDYLLNVGKLFIYPAIASFFTVWVLTSASEKFYDRYKTHKQELEVIDRRIAYEGRIREAKDEKKIREIIFEEKDIRYDNNNNFNNWYDDNEGNIKIGEYEFIPSESLYKLDYDAYKEELEKYKRGEHIPF